MEIDVIALNQQQPNDSLSESDVLHNDLLESIVYKVLNSEKHDQNDFMSVYNQMMQLFWFFMGISLFFMMLAIYIMVKSKIFTT